MDKQALTVPGGAIRAGIGAAARHIGNTMKPVGKVGIWALLTGLGMWGANKVGESTGNVIGSHNANEDSGRFVFGNPKDGLGGASYWNTINPISGLLGDRDRIPEWWGKMFPKTETGQQIAGISFKSGAIALLTAGLVGGYRTLKHYGEMEDLESADRPGKDLAGHLSTTFTGKMNTNNVKKQQKKKAADEDSGSGYRAQYPDSLAWTNLLGSAIPLGASLLAAAATYKYTDKYFDKQRNDALTKSIAKKDKAVKDLIATRARLAKGTLNNAESKQLSGPGVSVEDAYTKDASLDKQALIRETAQLLGLMGSAAVLASAIGSYAYFSASDENNLKYKAYKKALREYAKNKSGITPVTILPKDSQAYFDSINGNKGAAKSTAAPRDQLALDTDSLNRPISISI